MRNSTLRSHRHASHQLPPLSCGGLGPSLCACDHSSVGFVKGFLATGVAMFVLMVAASGALASHALSPARYATLDAAYTALIPLDKDRVSASALAAAKAACNGLDRFDPLLAPLRDQCYALVRIVKAAQRYERCRTQIGCQRAAAGMRKALNIYIASARRGNRAVDLFVSDPACRSALRTSAKDLRDARRLASAFRLLERALTTSSRPALRRAERLIDALDDSGPSARHERDRFRAACR